MVCARPGHGEGGILENLTTSQSRKINCIFPEHEEMGGLYIYINIYICIFMYSCIDATNLCFCQDHGLVWVRGSLGWVGQAEGLVSH